MKTRRFLVALTALNLVLLAFSLIQSGATVMAQSVRAGASRARARNRG